MLSALQLRDLNFATLRESLDARRGEVYAAFVRFGPCTTRHLAELTGQDVLSVRPRACELGQMGLLREVDTEHRGRVRETVYRAATLAEWQAWRAEHFCEGRQLQMGLTEGATA